MEPVVSPQAQSLIQRATSASTNAGSPRVQLAFDTATECYSGQMHWTGVSLIEHVVGALEVLAPFEPDEDMIIACLLHHVLQPGGLSLLDIEQKFGPQVRGLVSGVHLLSHVTLEGRRRSIEDLRVILLSVSDDLRVILIALCDRSHCLSFIGSLTSENAKRISKDVLQLYAPVAARLGIYSLKHSLEDRAFPVLYPDDAARIQEQIARLQSERPGFFTKAVRTLKDFLKEQGITAEVEVRQKHPYSVFLKMKKKNITDVRDVYDLYAVRVVVDSEADCYQVLGHLHHLGRPVQNRFKDYIAFPKPNGYQSLHTTLTQLAGLPEDVFVEIQIRSQSMDREAKYGVAAHWSYKEHGATRHAMEKVQLHKLLLGQHELESDETVSFADHIFVLTPRGDIIELPEGATPLDFAFEVHTDLGLAFRAAKVNGSIVSLDHELENGDVVEIQKDKNPRASPQWMQLLKMASSRSKLKRYLYAQRRPEFIARGRELVNEEFRKHHHSPLTTDLSIMRLVDGQTLTMSEREDVLMKIGQDAERASSLLSRLDLLKAREPEIEHVRAEGGRLQRKDSIIGIEGGIAMPIRYAKCCEPAEWPHEDIVGNINREGEVMIHREGCRMVKNTNPERRINVWWK